MRRWLKWTLWGAGGLVALALLAIGGALVYLSTAGGRDWAVEALLDAVSEPDMRISASGIEGDLLDRLVLTDVILADGDGPAITLDRVTLDWRPTSLASRRVAAEELTLEGVTVLRALPAGADTEDDALPFPFSPVELPVHVAVERLRVDGLTLSEGLVPGGAAYALDGRVAFSRTLDRLDLRLDARRTDQPGDRLALRLRLHPGMRAPEAALDLTAEPGGPLAGLIGLPDRGLRATLSGAEADGAWAGTLTADAGADRLADLALRLREADGLQLSLEGDVRPHLIAPALRPAGETLRLALVAGLTGTRLAVERLTVTSAAMRLSATGGIDHAEERIDLRAEGTMPDISVWTDALGTPVSGRLIFSGSARGALARPAIDADLRTEAGRVASARWAAARTQISLSPGDEGWSGRWQVTTTRLAVAGPGDDVPEIRALQGQAAVTAAYDLRRVALDDLRLEADGARVTGNAALDTSGPAPRLAGRLEVAGDLPAALLGGMSAPGARADIRFDLDPDRLTGDVQATARAERLRTAENRPLPLLAGPLTADIALRLRDDAIRLDRLRFESAQMTVSGSGAVDASERGRLRLRAEVPDLSPLSEALGQSLTGGATASAEFRGSLDELTVDARLQANALRIGEERIGRLAFDLQSANVLADAPRARLVLTAPDLEESLRLAANATITGTDRLDFEEIDARAFGVRAQGRLALALQSGLAAGELRLAAPDLSTLEAPLGLPMAGSASGTVTLSAETGNQATRVRLTASNTQVGGATARTARIEAQAADLATLAGVRGRAILEGVEAAGIAADRLEASAVPAGDAYRVTARANPAEGTQAAALDLAALVRPGAETEIALERLEAAYRGQSLSLAEAGTIRISETATAVSPHRFAVGDGSIRLQGRVSGSALDGEFGLTALPAGLLGLIEGAPNLTGRIDGTVALAGTLARPDIAFDLNATELRAAGLSGDVPGVNLSAAGRMRRDRITLQGQLSGLQDEPLAFSADLPSDFDAAGARVEGRLSGPVDLARLDRLDLLRGNRVTGTMRLDLQLAGTAAAPQLTGSGTLADGSFANPRYGMLLRGIELSIRTSGETLQLAGRATDGGSGTVQMEGTVTADAGRDFPLTARIRTEQATLLRTDEAQATLTGDLTAQGDLVEGLEIAGRITVNRGEIRIPERLPPDIVIIEVEERNTPAGLEEAEPEREAPPLPIRVDVRVDVPRQLFVRGRGIETEWQGNLHFLGELPTPDVTGVLNTVRGNVDVIGRRFEVERGEVRFDRLELEDPSLFIRATSRRDELLAIIEVTGSAQNPQIALKAEPDLPPEEVLSRVLFGESVDNMSPAQAARLAGAASDLFGSEGSLDIMGRVRSTLGLDVLDVTGEGEDTRVRAGRYIGRRSLLRIEQGISEESSRVGVEVEVIDNLVIQSDVGTQNDTRVGVEYRFDY